MSKFKGGGARQASNIRYVAKGSKNKVIEIPVPSLHILNLHVKQGAGILFLVTYDKPKFRIVYSLLVDGGHGNNYNAIRDILADHSSPDQRIDAACITHADADHANCAVKLKRYVKEYFVPYERVTTTLGSVTGTVPTMHSTTQLWTSGSKMTGIARLDITWVHVWQDGQPTPDGENSMSLAAVVSWGKFKYYFDGDLHATKQLELARNEAVLRNVDCFYVTHHGSKHSSFPPFLAKLNPTVAIVSTGKNSFQHPHADTLSNLRTSANIKKVVLTHCHYNRSLLNPTYWQTEKDNFERLYTIRNAATEVLLQKLTRDYLNSLKATVLDASNGGYMNSVDGMDQAIVDAHAALEQRDSDNVKKKLAIEDMAVINMTEFNEMFDEMTSAITANEIFEVAGDDAMKSAIVISLEGRAPDHYYLAYRRQSVWSRQKFVVGKKNPAPGHEDFVPHQPLYKLSERVYSDTNFNNSNRYARDLGAEVLYQCIQCRNMIHPAGAAVLINCVLGNCGGERAYHAACLIRAWGEMPILASVKSQVEDRVDLLMQVEEVADSDMNGPESDDEEYEEEEFGPLVLNEALLCPAKHIVYSTRKRERDNNRRKVGADTGDDMDEGEEEDDTPPPSSKKAKGRR